MIDDLCDSGCWKRYKECKLKIFVFEIGVKESKDIQVQWKRFLPNLKGKIWTI
jgi:hypothetical protein